MRVGDASSGYGVQIFGAGLSYFNGGNVGIGTAAPSVRFHVAGGDTRLDGSVAIGGTAISANNLLTISNVVADPTTFLAGASVSRGQSLTVNSAHQIFGLISSSNVTGAANATGVQRGLQSTAQHSGTGIISNARGAEAVLYNTSVGTISNGDALRGVIQNLSAAGTIVNAAGLTLSLGFNNGTISNTYGIQIGNLTGGTQASAPYAIFSTDPNARTYLNGNVGLGTTVPTARLDNAGDTYRQRTSRTPASASAAGNTGDICWDANYLYTCVATNTWKRSALSTW